MPEEEVAVVLGVDLNVSVAGQYAIFAFSASILPCMHLQQRFRRAGQVVYEVVRLRLLYCGNARKP
jgi:hypothetical protein